MRTLVYLIAVAALAVPSTAAAQSGTIAFHQHTFDNANSDLWLATADGTSGAVRLTSPSSAPDPTACFDACAAEAPDWSPRVAALLRLELDAVRAHLVDEAGRDGRPAGDVQRRLRRLSIGLGGRKHDRLRLRRRGRPGPQRDLPGAERGGDSPSSSPSGRSAALTAAPTSRRTASRSCSLGSSSTSALRRAAA